MNAHDVPDLAYGDAPDSFDTPDGRTYSGPVTAGTPEPERDLSNAQCVGRNGYGEISLGLPRIRMTRDEALVHAAWLVILAGGELEIVGIIAAIGGAV